MAWREVRPRRSSPPRSTPLAAALLITALWAPFAAAPTPSGEYGAVPIGGSFESGGSVFPFTADLSDDVVTLATGGATYVMRHVSAAVPPANPLGGAEAFVDALLPWTHRRTFDHAETRNRNPSARTTL